MRNTADPELRSAEIVGLVQASTLDPIATGRIFHDVQDRSYLQKMRPTKLPPVKQP